jgi:hypothetical protein
MKYFKTQSQHPIIVSIMFMLFVIGNAVTTKVNAESIPATLNLPTIYDATVNEGDTLAELNIIVDNVESMKIDVIVPVNGASVSLIDPAGNVVTQPNDPATDYLPGSAEAPILPGGVFALPRVVSPSNGVYVLRVTFPSATDKTGILATVTQKSSIKVGLIIPGGKFLQGQTSTIGLLIVDASERPVLSQLPIIEVTSPSGNIQALAGLDNGLVVTSRDGKADDGLYSTFVTFDEVGTYIFNANVAVDVNGTIYSRSAFASAEVVAPNLTVIDVEQSVTLGRNSCVAGLGITTTAENFAAGLFVSSALISDANGNLLQKNANSEALESGIVSPSINLTAEELREAGLRASPFSVVELRMLSLTPESYSLEFEDQAQRQWQTAPASVVCTDAIEISRTLTVTPQLQDNYIASLSFSFDIVVERNSTYQTSFKITDSSGQDIEVYGVSQFMATGDNTITVSLDSAQLQNIDGPYTVESVLVIGGGKTAQLSVLGSSQAYSKWQFLPTKEGDLDADGDVDSEDRAILIQLRNSPVYTIGDRRDLDRNGKIDLRDVRRIMYLR